MKKKMAIAIFLTVLSAGSFFIFNFILARVLGGEIYGEIQYYVSYIQLVFLSLSLNYASLYMGNKILNNDKNTFSLYFSLQTFFFLMIFLPVFFLLKNFIENNSIIILILLTGYFLVLLTSIALEYNSENRIIDSLWIGSTVSRLIHIALFSILTYLGYGYSEQYLLVYLLSVFCVVVYVAYRFKPTLYLNFKFLSRAWKFYLLGIIGSSFVYIAQILQKELYGFSQLATLALALLIMNGLGMWGSLLIKLTLPAAHRFWKTRDINGLSKIYKSNTYLELIVITPLFLLIFFNIERISNSLGSQYSQLPMVFYILSIGYSIEHVTGITGSLLRVTENEHFELFNVTIRLIIGLILIYFLKGYDYGTVIAISISTVIFSFLKFIELYHLFKIWPLSKLYSLELMISLLSVSLLFYAISNIQDMYTYVTLATTILCIVYYFIYSLIKRSPELTSVLVIK